MNPALTSGSKPEQPVEAAGPVTTPTTGHQPALSEPQSKDETLLKRYGETNLLQLWILLMNGNALYDYVMGFVDKEKKIYARAKTLPIANALRRAMATILGTAAKGRDMVVAAYARNQDGQTCWGAFDFDYGADGGAEARGFAAAALQEVMKGEDRYIILEETHNGLHLFIIKKRPFACESWTEFLADIASRIGAPLKRGVCEIFPPLPTSMTNVGYALRLPGTWNPSSGTVGTILFENIEPIISGLEENPPEALSSSFSKRDKCFLSREDTTDVEDKNKASSEREENNGGKIAKKESREKKQADYEQKWAQRHPINRPRQRNECLKSLVSNIYYVVSRETGRQIAERQFLQKTVETEADVATHLKDFDEMWDSMEKHAWLPSLNPIEARKLEELTTAAERDAFRIIGGFAQFAKKSNQTDFFIVRDDLGCRLGLSGPGAGKLVERFITLKIVQRSQDYIPKVAAARYRWRLDVDPPAISDPPFDALVKPTQPGPSLELSGGDAYGCAPPANLFERKIMSRFGEQIVAILGIYGMLPLSELRQKIVGYREHVALAERVVARLQLRLLIDVDVSGAIKLGPRNSLLPVFRAMQILSKTVGPQLRDNPASLERLASHYSLDPAALTEARRRMFALGYLMTSELNRLLPHPHADLLI